MTDMDQSMISMILTMPDLITMSSLVSSNSVIRKKFSKNFSKTTVCPTRLDWTLAIKIWVFHSISATLRLLLIHSPTVLVHSPHLVRKIFVIRVLIHELPNQIWNEQQLQLNMWMGKRSKPESKKHFCSLQINKKLQFCRVYENGQETITVTEDGVVKSSTINSVPSTNKHSINF